MDSYARHCAGLVRSLFILLSVLLYSNACAAEKPAGSRQRSLAILASIIQSTSPRPVSLYTLNEPVRGGQSIKSWNRVVHVPPGFTRAWFYFIDDMPGANWEHPCRYVFIDHDSGNFEILEASTPPDQLNDMTRITLP